MDEDRTDTEQEQEWLRQHNVIYGGLIGVGVVMVQPFLAAGSPDPAAQTSVVAFSVAIPLLAALLLLNHQEAFRRRPTNSFVVAVARAGAQSSAAVGVIAAFFNISRIAGITALASAIVGVAVHSAGYTRLERDGERLPPAT